MLYKVYYSIGEKRMWMEVEANSHTHAEQVLMRKLTIVKVVPSDSQPEPKAKSEPKPRPSGESIWEFLRKSGILP
jgi:hypothetical protein